MGDDARALAHARLLAELVAWLDGRVRLPEERLPDAVRSGDPAAIEAAAAACRRLWGLAPDLPLPNLTRVVERAGIVVAEGREGPAFARVGRRYLVVIDRSSPGDRRFELARMIGHVILQRSALEAEADRFAGALLLPREGLLRELPRAPSLDAAVLVPLARRWKVSLAALVRRAAELPIANAARYRDVAEHLSGTRPQPPTMEDPDEVPEVIALALQQIEQGLGIRRIEVARRLGWSPQTFASVTGLEVAPRAQGNVISLAAWKARRAGSERPAERGHQKPGGVQLELDFGPSSLARPP